MSSPDRPVRRDRANVRAARGPRRRSSRGGFLKRAAALLFLALVLLGAVAVYLWVEVGHRFEGRLWDFPSRVYSDRLVLAEGVAVSAEALARRLDRCGYARIEGAPGSPGQYRWRGDRLDANLRPLSGPWGDTPSRRAIVRFADGVVAAVESPGGRALARVEIEPELLALLSGPQQEEREVVRLQDAPKRLVQAVLAAEDSRFYSHRGLDPVAILRAAFADVRSARIVQGGSTITQQTVKNLYLGQERTWWRKIREALLAVVLDARYPKDRILEVYLNEVYLGQRGSVAVCGVASAARFYLGKDLEHLTLGECALLAGLIRNPGGCNPFTHPEAAVARREQVLRKMAEERQIGEAEVESARAEPLRLASGKEGHSRAPYVVDLVRSQLAELYTPTQLAREGLRIYTTLDTTLQEAAQGALSAGLERLDRERAARGKAPGEKLEGCALVLRPSSGAVLALVGGRDYGGSQFNRAVQARRQAGSSFKPFVYLAGFEAAIRGREGGLTPATVLDDSPIEVTAGGRTWRPSNYDGEFLGPVTARQALEQSLNVPTVRAALRVGLKEVAHTAETCGLPSLAPYPSIALGAQEVSPLDLASAYCVFPNAGKRVDARIVREVTSREGESLERRKRDAVQVVTPQAAWLATDMMRGVLLRGTAASSFALGFRGNAAGKTGTTDDTRDAWFVGFTPDLLALVWVGYDDNAKTGLTGASGALPIWVDLLRRAGRFTEAPFREPEGIVRVELDPGTGGLAVAGCPARVEEAFAEGTEPVDDCPLHSRGVKGWLRRLFGRSTRPGV
jgi:penicillin-binding protein 1B